MLAQLRQHGAHKAQHESIGRAVYPAACGRHVRCGIR
jgi:hypothetical protein